MNSKDFCDLLRNNLTSWRDEVQDLIMDSNGSSRQNLDVMSSQIEYTMNKLDEECPFDVEEHEEISKETHRPYSPYDFG